MRSSPAHFVLTILSLLILAAGCGSNAHKDLATGREKLAQGEYRAAVRLLKRTTRSLPGNPSAHCNLGIAYWKLDLLDQAIGSLNQAVELTTTNTLPLEFLVAVNLDAGDLDAAERAAERALARTPESARVLTVCAQVHYRRGSSARALESLEKALAIDPRYPPALYNMAQALRRSDPNAAITFYQKYLRVALQGDHVAKARQLLRATAEQVTAPRPPPDGPSPAKPWLEKARTALQEEAFDEALVLLDQAAKADPGNADVAWERALLFDQHLSYREKAVQAYLDFARLFPDDTRTPQADERLAALDSGSAAREDAERKRKQAGAVFRQAYALHRQGKMDEATDLYRQALAQDPALTDASYNLGLVLKAKEDYTGAKEAFQYVTRVHPEKVRARYMLAVVHRELGKNEDALEELSRILQHDPDYARAHFLLGLVYAEENTSSRAKVHFRNYLRLAPDGPSAPQARQWLNRAP